MLKYALPIDIDFLGVWDTVGALGLPFGNLPILGKQDMQFLNTGSDQNPVVLVAVLDGNGLADAGFRRLLYFVNVAPEAQQLTLPTEIGITYTLHPIHLNAAAADKRPAASASFDPSLGRFTVPARTALVWVQR